MTFGYLCVYKQADKQNTDFGDVEIKQLTVFKSSLVVISRPD